MSLPPMGSPPPFGPPPPAGPPPPRPYAANWSVQRNAAAPVLIIGVVVAFVVILMMVGLGASMIGGGSFGFALFPFCGIFLFFLIIIVLVAVGAVGQGSRSLPPPPPIQQPMVPAGTQGPVALNCPNCGAPPSNVDRFGVATCTYCNTRFLVR